MTRTQPTVYRDQSNQTNLTTLIANDSATEIARGERNKIVKRLFNLF